MRLEKWFISQATKDAQVIYGFVYDNPKFEEGAMIHTSKVVELDKDKKWVRTLNSLYDLGEEWSVSDFYE